MQNVTDSVTEHSVQSCYTVVYDFSEQDRTWQVAGEGGWSELHICLDESDGSYRILAWTHDTQTVLVNVNLDHRCEYKEKSDNFHSFKDENGLRRGFGFHKSDRNLQSAKDFLEVVRSIITELRRAAQASAPSANRNASLIQTVPVLPQHEMDRGPPVIHEDGTMQILQSSKAKHAYSQESISDVSQVKREGHVELNENGEYVMHGATFLPEGWEAVANQKFNVPPASLRGVLLDPYDFKVPILLEQMKHRIKQLNGLQEVGIFRLAPDATECDRMKEMMNSGQDWQDEDCDVNAIANLLKIWFRSLPTPILNIVEPALIEMNHDSVEGVANAIPEFPECERTLLLWLWDFCVEIAEHQDVNKMGVQNLSIVIGPNLFNTDNFQNPMKAMEFSSKVVGFFQKGVEWRQQVLGRA